MKTFRRLLPLFFLALALAPAPAHAFQGGGRETTPTANSAQANDAEIDETLEYKQSPVVKKMASMTGMKPATVSMLSEVLNFAVLALALGFFLARALPKLFRDRTSGIQKKLVDARSATEEASARLSSVEDRLAKLDGQIAAMRAQAEQDIAADEVRIKGSIEDETKKILAAADQEIAAATQHAQRQLQQYAAELAIDQAARKLVISAETDRLLVQGFVSRLAGNEKKGDN